MRRKIGWIFVLVLLFSAPVQAQGIEMMLGWNWVFNPPEVGPEGSLQVRLWLNLWAAVDGVERIPNDRVRNELIRTGELVPLKDIPNLDVARDLNPNKRYLRTWAASALRELAQMYRLDTGRDLPLNSALRTKAQQAAMLPRRAKIGGRWRWVGNPNAIPAEGVFGSTHPYGITVDLARFRIPDRYEPDFEAKLLRLESARCLDLTKEGGQAVYHVTFFKRCVPDTLAVALYGTR